MIPMKTPRGISNRNPGNLEKGSPWQGRAAVQTDSRFVQFISPEYGIRALAKVLLTYYAGYDIDTVAGIINRWAPPVENNTDAYIASVAKVMGVSPVQPLQINQRTVMVPLIKAIIQHENGQQPYSDETIDKALNMAGMPF